MSTRIFKNFIIFEEKLEVIDLSDFSSRFFNHIY